MALEGTFGDFGLAEIFQLIGLQKKTGVLTVKGGDEDAVVTVSFDKGMVTFADEYQRGETERLGNLLIRSHLITKEALAKAVETQKETLQRLGHVLVQMNFISQEDLRGALQAQVKETVYRLFRWKEGSYNFSSEPVAYDKEMYQPIAAEYLLMEGVRMIDEWPIIETKIGSFDTIFEMIPGRELPPEEAKTAPAGKGEAEDLMAIVDEAKEEVSPTPGNESKLSPQEEGIFKLVNGRRNIQDIIDIGKIGEFETCKILFGFLSVGLIRPVEKAASAKTSRHAPKKTSLPVNDIAVLVILAVLSLAALLFNPFSMFTMRYSVQQSRKEIGSLKDDMKVLRLHHALKVFYLEKQSYPLTLEKLKEDEMVGREDIKSNGRKRFSYRGEEKAYFLGRE